MVAGVERGKPAELVPGAWGGHKDVCPGCSFSLGGMEGFFPAEELPNRANTFPHFEGEELKSVFTFSLTTTVAKWPG